MTRSVMRPLAAFGFVGLAALVLGAAQAPQRTEERAARLVVAQLENKHMAKPTIDDETAKKWAKMFLKDLDPQKIYFLKGDIDEFLPQATTLDDKVREGDLSFARQVFDRFLKRADERYKMVAEIVAQKPDFTADESMVDDPDKQDAPADEAEARDRLRKRIKLELLQSKVDNEPDDEAVRKLLVRYKDRNLLVHQFNNDDLLEIYLSSLSRTFDPHSVYMNKESVEDLMQQIQSLSLTGIGASLQSEGGYAVVKELIPGGPAEKDGHIEPEDKILGIQKDDGTEVDFVEKRLRDVVRQIRGDAGTHVRLIIQPHGSKDKKVYDIVRQKVELKESHAKGQVIENKVDGKPFKVGVISLPAFYGDSQAVADGQADAVSCTNDCKKLIDGFKAQKVDAVMMDLRGNGGGLLTEAISLSGLFIDTGPVVQVREANFVRHLDDDEVGTAWDGPLVVVIDRQSASASEIFAGVIKDYGRGLIVGDVSTFGKGTVQSIMEIKDPFSLRSNKMGALKLTIQQFYRVNGDSTQIRGVESDIHIPSLFDQADFGEGKMDNAMKFDHVAGRPHDNYNRLSPELVARLNSLSERRRGESEKFAKRDAAIKRLIDRKARHAISLNEAKFRAETVSEEENKDEAKTDSKPKAARKRFDATPVWESNYYNDEIVAIVGDYLHLGQNLFGVAPLKAAAN